MKLIVLRHAKSVWDDPLLPDHDRPLNARGRKGARAIGAWLNAKGHLPDLTLCSTAARTQETLALLALPEHGQQVLPQMYHASEDRLLHLAQQAQARTLLLVGHNPGIGGLAQMLAQGRVADPDFSRYPTGACLVVECADGIAPGCGRVLDFVTPKGLNP